MKIAVWRTGHEIADTVAEAIKKGLNINAYRSWINVTDELYFITGTMDDFRIRQADLHIGYGILRGIADVFRACDKAGKPWINVDRGYFHPGHYDGYYRFSLNGTQQTDLTGLEPDYARLDMLSVDCRPTKSNLIGPALVCPPTDYAVAFFNQHNWGKDITEQAIWRTKNCQRPLQDDLDRCSKVITFNSSVGWEALRQGIPVISDPDHSIVGAYQKMVDKPLHMDLNSRRRLFGIMAGLQLSLNEIKNGLLWPLLQRLLKSGLAGIPERVSQDTSPAAQFFVAQPQP